MSEALSIRVLLVEDDEDVQVGFTQALTLAGFEVEAFGSAERARAHINFSAPVIVVCDVRLPGQSGTDWLPEIRKIDPELPVVLVTGHGHIAMAVQAMRTRACGDLQDAHGLAYEAVATALPGFLASPRALGERMSAMLGEHLDLCQATATDPDMDLVGPLRAHLGVRD